MKTNAEIIADQRTKAEGRRDSSGTASASAEEVQRIARYQCSLLYAAHRPKFLFYDSHTYS